MISLRPLFRQALLLTVSLLLPLNARAATAGAPGEARLEEIGRSKPWLRLLHYEKNLFGRDHSLLDGKGFFFAPNGDRDPVAELKASLAAMSNDGLKVGRFKLHPQCAFPERFRFLKEKLGPLGHAVSCPKLDEFLAQFHDPRAVSVVYSSAYPNNPASAFGHTFLRIHAQRRADLIDTGINFAADVPPDENPFAFFWFGVTGGYHGQWSMQPYYVKIDEYVNSESRDLWEYELNLTADETRRLLLHLWELETNSYFDYYFFDENCSYQILGALEAVRPDWDLMKYSLGLLPGESVKNLMFTPGAVRDVRFRPSLNHQFFHVYDTLNGPEQSEFLALIRRTNPLESFTSRPVLDAAIGYLDYVNNEHHSTYEKQYAKFREALLLQRAHQGPSTAEEIARVPKLAGETRPDLGHDAYAVQLGQGYRDQAGMGEGFNSIVVKAPYHDLLNNDLGFARYAHIRFPSLELQYDWRHKNPRVERMTLLSATSLMPYSRLDPRFSWHFDSGLYTARDSGVSAQPHLFAEGGLGSAIKLGSPRHLLYTFGLLRSEASSHLRLGYRVLPGVETGLLANPTNWYKTWLAATHYWNLVSRQNTGRLLRVHWDHAFYLRRNWEIHQTNGLEFSSARSRPVAEFKLETIFFFK